MSIDDRLTPRARLERAIEQVSDPAERFRAKEALAELETRADETAKVEEHRAHAVDWLDAANLRIQVVEDVSEQWRSAYLMERRRVQKAHEHRLEIIEAAREIQRRARKVFEADGLAEVRAGARFNRALSEFEGAVAGELIEQQDDKPDAD